LIVEQPPIAKTSAAMLYHQMTDQVVRGRNLEKARGIEASGLVPAAVQWTAEMRDASIPIIWVRVERRADRKDRVNVVTDRFPGGLDEHYGPLDVEREHARPKGQNLPELPMLTEDHLLVKTRYDPFIGTALDLQLRALKVDTLLIGGIQEHVGGIESCARGAYDRDYNVVVLKDLCYGTAPDLWDWSLRRVLPYFSRVMDSKTARSLLR
jgi:nicotinamidase-related amidase